MQHSHIAVPQSMEVKICNSQARDTPSAIGTLEHLVKVMQKTSASSRQRQVSADNNAPSTFPTGRPPSSSSSNRPRSLTPRTSSEHGSFSSNETRRTSFTDEAQTSYNILLILRTDTQHLISLRNDNLTALEDKSGLAEDAASSRIALLACINESITAATRSITQLGPFLDKHRWPVGGRRPATPESQRRSFTISLRPRRRRPKSSTDLTGADDFLEDGGTIFSPEDLFSWTLALTAQHTAVLVATERLCTFLQSGIANVSEEEKKRRDARASWWEQGRGGFENVGLIQSLLGRPHKTVEEASAEETATVVTNSTVAESRGDGAGTAANLTPITENDDGRFETLSEGFTPLTLASTPKGLTARPRRQRMGSLQHEEGFSVRRVFTEPLPYSSPVAQSSNEARLSRMETFGSEKPAVPLSRFSSSKQRSRIATSPLPSVITSQHALADLLDIAPEQGHQRSVSTCLISEDGSLCKLSKGGAPAPVDKGQPTPPFTPSASPEKHNAPQINVAFLSNEFQTGPSPSPSPGEETVHTPYTPLDANFTSLFTQRALTLPLSKTPHQPMIQDPSHILRTSDPGAENTALRVSPIEARSRVSIAPAIEGPDNVIVSPLESDGSGTLTQPLLGVSPITVAEEQASLDDAEAHMAWLRYMERKQQVSGSRWSLHRAKTSEV